MNKWHNNSGFPAHGPLLAGLFIDHLNIHPTRLDRGIIDRQKKEEHTTLEFASGHPPNY